MFGFFWYSTYQPIHVRQGRYLMNDIEQQILAAEAEEQELYGKMKDVDKVRDVAADAWSASLQRLRKLQMKSELLAEMKGEK